MHPFPPKWVKGLKFKKNLLILEGVILLGDVWEFGEGIKNCISAV